MVIPSVNKHYFGVYLLDNSSSGGDTGPRFRPVRPRFGVGQRFPQRADPWPELRHDLFDLTRRFGSNGFGSGSTRVQSGSDPNCGNTSLRLMFCFVPPLSYSLSLVNSSFYGTSPDTVCLVLWTNLPCTLSMFMLTDPLDDSNPIRDAFG